MRSEEAEMEVMEFRRHRRCGDRNGSGHDGGAGTDAMRCYATLVEMAAAAAGTGAGPAVEGKQKAKSTSEVERK